MNTMLVISGIWIAILPRMTWYSLELKKLNIGYYCIGLYMVLLGVLSIIELKIYDVFFVLAFIFSALLEISTIILRLKGEKNFFRYSSNRSECCFVNRCFINSDNRYRWIDIVDYGYNRGFNVVINFV